MNACVPLRKWGKRQISIDMEMIHYLFHVVNVCLDYAFSMEKQ